MRRLVLALALFVWPSLGLAEPFGGSELMVGRGVKPPKADRTFTAGLNVAVSPLNAVLSSQKQALVDQAVATACKGDKTCEANVRANAEVAMDTLASIPDSKWDQVQAAAADPSSAAFQQALKDAGVTDPKQQKAITDYASKVPAQDRVAAVSLSRKLASENATNLLMEPFAEVNLRWVQLRASAPFTLAIRSSGTDAYMGNCSLEARSGGQWDFGVVSLALAGGLALYVPTSSQGSQAAALTDLFQSPKYLYGYLTLAPYLAAGLELPLVTLQAHLELDSAHRVRGNASNTSMQYLRYGTGLVLAPRFFVSLIAELNGLVPARNADLFNALFFTGGLQFKLWIMKLSVAAQVPVYHKKEELGTLGGVDLGELSAYSVLARLAFIF